MKSVFKSKIRTSKQTFSIRTHSQHSGLSFSYTQKKHFQTRIFSQTRLLDRNFIRIFRNTPRQQNFFRHPSSKLNGALPSSCKLTPSTRQSSTKSLASSTKLPAGFKKSYHSSDSSPSKVVRIRDELPFKWPKTPKIDDPQLCQILRLPDTHDKTLTAADFGLKVYPNAISVEEEESLVAEIEKHVQKFDYQKTHWDEAISHFREIEKYHWLPENQKAVTRLQTQYFEEGLAWLPIHCLDLDTKGEIFPHVDSLKFSGGIVAGLCLLSDAIIHFHHEDDPKSLIQAKLPRRSLYITRGEIRNHWKHAILNLFREISDFPAAWPPVSKSRRISLMFRDELEEQQIPIFKKLNEYVHNIDKK